MSNKSKILIITGQDAFQEIEFLNWESAKNKYELIFEAADIATAAFISPSLLLKTLLKFSLNEFQWILVSGLIPWDLSEIKSQFAPKLKKGPKFLALLPDLLENLDISLLSSKEPADKIFHEILHGKIEANFHNIKNQLQKSPSNSWFSLSKIHPGIIISPQLPPLLIAEIVDFPKFSFEELCQKIAYFIQEGAQVIDLGCIVNQNHTKLIQTWLPQIRAKFSIPFSIDSINREEIRAAVDAGVEMVLSVNPDNVDQLLDLPKDLVLVVIPVSFKNRNRNYNLIESNPITILNDLSQKLIHAGFTKILLDPLTDAPIVPGILPSIENLIQLQKSISETFDSEKLKHLMCKPQLFMGIGNVTELMDADSPGINAFLAILAVEMSISAILSTEYSQKNRKGLEELRQGINLAFRAKTLHVPPINIGISALRLKSKSPYPKYLKFGEPIDKVTAEETPAEMDPLGYFKMGVDLENNHIWITHYTNRQEKRDVTHTFTGTSAESLYKRIITEKLVSRLDHAAYLGKELMRAELALKYGTEYREN